MPSEKVAQNKWWLLVDPRGEWVTGPVAALTALDAIKEQDVDSTKELGNEWRAYQLVSPGYEDFKTAVEVVPALR